MADIGDAWESVDIGSMFERCELDAARPSAGIKELSSSSQLAMGTDSSRSIHQILTACPDGAQEKQSASSAARALCGSSLARWTRHAPFGISSATSAMLIGMWITFQNGRVCGTPNDCLADPSSALKRCRCDARWSVDCQVSRHVTRDVDPNTTSSQSGYMALYLLTPVFIADVTNAWCFAMRAELASS